MGALAYELILFTESYKNKTIKIIQSTSNKTPSVPIIQKTKYKD
jgi:hypothetical protein